MTQVKYTGNSHFRVLRPEDFARLGVEGIYEVQWAQGETVEVNDDAADVILQLMPDEFEKVGQATSVFIPAQHQPAPPADAAPEIR